MVGDGGTNGRDSPQEAAMRTRVVPMRRARHLMGALGVVASTVVLPFALTGPAGAIGGSCSSAMEKQVVSGPDMYRVRASCSSIDSDTKVRGMLVIDGDLDAPTAWFTTPNKTLRIRSSRSPCPQGRRSHRSDRIRGVSASASGLPWPAISERSQPCGRRPVHEPLPPALAGDDR